VPALPFFGADAPGGILGRIECPAACEKAVAEHDAVRIARGGSPGISPEWVLRMPVGKTYDLGRTSFTLQDLADARPISLPQAPYRVTLLEACPANTRVGAVTRLEFAQNATVPIPTGFHTSRWVQLEGCAALAKRAPPREPPPPPAAAVSLEVPGYAYRPPELGIVVPQRGAVGRLELIVDESRWLMRRIEKMHVSFRRICRYEPQGNRWLPLAKPEGALEISGPGLMNRTRVAYRFDEGPGLYWAQWSEAPDGDAGAAADFALVIPGGTSVHCRESELPQPGAGEIALCVPRHGPALPGVVPDPAAACPPASS